MQGSRNRILGVSDGRDDKLEHKTPAFKTMLYNYETGKVKAFYSAEDVAIAIESKLWVDSPRLTNRGEYLKRPEVCEFYVDRKCEKGSDCEDEKVEVEPEKILPKPVALAREGSFKLEVPEDKGTEVLEPIVSKIVVSKPDPNLFESQPEPPKLKKALSQMSQPDLIEEGKLHGFEFTTNDTKMKMTKMIRAAKSKK